MRKKESWMFKGAIVLAGGKKATITKMQENELDGVEYVYYISCKLEGAKTAGTYHPNDVQELIVNPEHKMANFKAGDPVIWNSGWGYDIGLFMSEDTNQYNTYRLDMVSGIVTGELSVPQSEVELYTEDRIKELGIKYGYIIKF